jgi:hypothetical protein
MNPFILLSAAALALIAQTQQATIGQVSSTPAPTNTAAAATVVEAKLAADGAFLVDLYADLDALLFGLSPAASVAQRLAAMERLRASGRASEGAAIERLTEFMRRRLRVRFDGAAAETAVEFPQRRSMPTGELATLGSFVRLRGQAPAEARAFTFFASRSFRGVDLRVALAGARSSRQIVEPGAESAPIAMPRVLER